MKSAYGKFCAVGAVSVWVVFLGYQAFVPLQGLNGNSFQYYASLGALAIMVATLGWLLWRKLAHLDVPAVVNSSKATIGIFSLSLALIAFPGMLYGPLAYAALTGRSETAWYAIYFVFAIPFFVILSIAGVVLVVISRPASDA